MALLIKIAFFIGFLVVYVAYLVGLVITSIRLGKSGQSNRDWFITNQILLVLPYLFLLAAIYLLAGDSILHIVLLFLIAGEFGLVVSALSMGTARSPWQQVATWQMVRLMVSRPWLSWLGFIVAGLSVFIYPAVAGVVYFTHARPSPDLTLLAVQWTLVLVLFSAAPIMLVLAANTLASEFIDERTRLRALIAYMGASVPIALTVALILWALRVPGVGTNVSIGSVSVIFAPQLSVVVAAYLVVTLVIPYAVGAQAAKSRHLDFLDQQRDFLSDAREALALPDAVRRAGQLTTLGTEIGARIGQLSEGDPGPNLVAASSKGSPGKDRDPSSAGAGPVRVGNPANDLLKSVPQALTAYLASLEHDPNHQYVAWLQNLKDDVSDALRDVGSRSKRSQAQRAQEWFASFTVKQDRVADEMVKASHAGTPFGFVAVSLLGPLVSSVFVTGFGGWLWKTFEHSALK